MKNYIWIAVAVFMLLFLFVPQIIDGTLKPIYYLGVIFWVVVIAFCANNIIKKSN